MESEFYEKIYKAWLEAAKKFSPLELKAPEPGKEAYSSSFGWLRDVDALFGKFLWFPPFTILQGTARPALDFYKEFWDLTRTYLDLYRDWISVYSDFSKAWIEGNTNAYTKLMSKPGELREHDPKHVYRRWVEELETRIDALLRDPGFASKLAGLLARALDAKKQGDSVMERYYTLMSLPTRSEVDAIYRELYELRKQMRATVHAARPVRRS